MTSPSRAEISAGHPSPLDPVGNGESRRSHGSGRWWARLPIGGRVALGFAVALALVLLLGASGLAFLKAVNHRLDGFASRVDISQTAAEIDISMRGIEIAVRDHLAEGDPDSLEEATAGVARLKSALTTLTGVVEDGAAVVAAQTALDAYWIGFDRIVDLKAERSRVLNERLPRLIAEARESVATLTPVGGVDSAALMGDVEIRLVGLRERALRFVARRDMYENESARADFAQIRDRLVGMRRYLWVGDTKGGLARLETALDGIEGVFQALDTSLVEEDAIRADTLVPNAAVVTERARDLRLAEEVATSRLKGDLSNQAKGFGEVVIWTAAAVVVLGGLMSAWLAWGVGRPVRQVARSLTALAAGETNVTVPVTPHDDEVAALARAVGTLRASTEGMARALAEAEAERDRLAGEAARLEALGRAKSDFLLNLGQELHAPLGGLVASAQSLMTELHGRGEVELANDADTMQWAGERLLGMVESVMDYARIEAGVTDLVLQDFDVARLLVESRERVMAQADLNGDTVTIDHDDKLGGMHSDFAKVRQILSNLLDNACRYTDNGDVTLAARREGRDGRDWLVFTVADNGPGFPVNRAVDLFRPFVRGGDRAERGRRGAGLGLTLVAHNTAMLGGELELAAAEGRGARFTVCLPAEHQSGDDERPLRIRAGAMGEQLGPPMPLLTDTAA